MTQRPFLEGGYELRIQRATVLLGDLTQGGQDVLVDIADVNRRHGRHVIISISLLIEMEIALALIAAAALGLALGRIRRRRREPVEELGGFLAGAIPVVLSHRDEELDLEEGALDPDELEGDPLYWDEGADDEVD